MEWIVKMWVLVILGYALTVMIVKRRRPLKVRHISKAGVETVFYLSKGESRELDELIGRVKHGKRTTG